MKIFQYPILLGIIIWLYTNNYLLAQQPFDEIMMAKGEVCVATIYEFSQWNQYYEGDRLRHNDNIGYLTKHTILPMMAIGIHKKLNVLVGLPYISTNASSGTQIGQSGLQDLNVSLKADWVKKRIGNGRLLFLTNAHVVKPIGQYLADYAPFSIGLGSLELGLRSIMGYKWDNGLVLRISNAYLWRGQSEIERDYYFKNRSIYSSFMDVPNAMHTNAAIGYWTLNKKLRMEATYTNLYCFTGDDIRSYHRGQPTNKTEMSQIGFWAQYYPKNNKGFGLLTYFNHTIDGRNIGKANNAGLGLTYQFKAL